MSNVVCLVYVIGFDAAAAFIARQPGAAGTEHIPIANLGSTPYEQH